MRASRLWNSHRLQKLISNYKYNHHTKNIDYNSSIQHFKSQLTKTGWHLINNNEWAIIKLIKVYKDYEYS